jgi:hypothetical protein
MIEAFGAGTAAIVSPVNAIAFEDKVGYSLCLFFALA